VAPLVLLVVAAFLPVLGNDFVEWDDQANILRNRHYRGLGWPQVRWACTTFHLGVYQPVAWLLLEAQYVVWGLDAKGYHLVSLLMHIANMVVLFGLTMALLERCRPDLFHGRPWARAIGAGLATALFAVHPLRVEAVAWVSGQPYLPCALFSLLTILAYLRAVGDGDRPRWGWLAASLVLFAAALLSHAPAVTLPAVLLILDFYPLRRLGGGPGRWFGPATRRVWLEKVPFLALSLVFMGIAFVAKSQARAIAALEKEGIAARIAQACYGVWFYLFKTVIPRDLAAFYPQPARIDWSAPAFLASIVATAALSVGLFLLRRRFPSLLAAWLSYLAILAPSSGLVRLGSYLVADRYSYLALAGIVVLVAAGLGRTWASFRRAPGRAAGIVLAAAATIAGLVALTRGQCRTWRDTGVLWSHVLEHVGDSSTARYSLGVFFFNQGKLEEAEAQFEAGARLTPSDPRPHYGFGTIRARQGRFAEATAQLQAAVRLDPVYVEAHFSLGSAYTLQGRFAEAMPQFDAAIRLRPDYAEALNERAMILAACPEARLRDGRKAVEDATRACELTGWDQPMYLDTLAAAYAEAGDFAAAVAWQEKAIERLEDEPQKDDFRSRLSLYRAGKPYRQSAPQRPSTAAAP
jgi:tetratricopeptide (TPR) repeat protein